MVAIIPVMNLHAGSSIRHLYWDDQFIVERENPPTALSQSCAKQEYRSKHKSVLGMRQRHGFTVWESTPLNSLLNPKLKMRKNFSAIGAWQGKQTQYSGFNRKDSGNRTEQIAQTNSNT